MSRASPALESFIDETIKRSQERGYHPTAFIAMRTHHGTVSAISRLVQSGHIQTGFKRLEALGLLEWTIESAVTKFPGEFSPKLVEAAQWRLEQARRGKPDA